MTPEHHVRFTINGMGVIQQYCRDDILNGKPFIAMKKDSASQDSQVDLDDYSVRVKTRREIPMENNDFRIKEIFGKWPQQKKAFRLIRRWSFEDMIYLSLDLQKEVYKRIIFGRISLMTKIWH